MTEPMENEKESTENISLQDSIELSQKKVEEELQQSWTSADKSSGPNIEHNFKAIRAILSLNTEILDRCMKHMVDVFVNDDDGKVMARFYRNELESVQANSEEVDDDICEVSIIAFPMVSEESFPMELLCTCPTHLALFQLKYLDCDFEEVKFVDYETLLERSLLLRENTLGPFLVELKKHLEAVQVLLGDIDAWIMEVNQAMEFIEKTFDISIPKTKPKRKRKHEPAYKSDRYADSYLTLQCFNVNNVQGEFTFKFKVGEEAGKQNLAKFLDFTSALRVEV